MTQPKREESHESEILNDLRVFDSEKENLARIQKLVEWHGLLEVLEMLAHTASIRKLKAETIGDTHTARLWHAADTILINASNDILGLNHQNDLF